MTRSVKNNSQTLRAHIAKDGKNIRLMYASLINSGYNLRYDQQEIWHSVLTIFRSR